MSAPICMNGVRRYPPVRATTSGLGSMLGTVTERQCMPFMPSTSRTFSENGEPA